MNLSTTQKMVDFFSLWEKTLHIYLLIYKRKYKNGVYSFNKWHLTFIGDDLFMDLKKQSDFINLLRGIAIFLMLWGHCIQYCCGEQFDFFENDLFKAIYSFHMPLFMTISGYLFFFSASKRELAELVPYKVKSLLYPILMGSIVNLIITIGIASLVCRKIFFGGG